ALALERMRLRQSELEPQHPDDHDRARAALRRALRLRALGGDVQPARHLLDLVRLDDVADLDVGVVLEARAALVPGRHLARVVLEALERADFAVVHDDAVAKQPRPGAALDLA